MTSGTIFPFDLLDATFRLVANQGLLVCEYQSFSLLKMPMWSRIEDDEIGWVLDEYIQQYHALAQKQPKRAWLRLVSVVPRVVSGPPRFSRSPKSPSPSETFPKIHLLVRRQKWWWPWSRLEFQLEIEEQDSQGAPTWKPSPAHSQFLGIPAGHWILLGLLSQSDSSQPSPNEELAQWN